MVNPTYSHGQNPYVAAPQGAAWQASEIIILITRVASAALAASCIGLLVASCLGAPILTTTPLFTKIIGLLVANAYLVDSINQIFTSCRAVEARGWR